MKARESWSGFLVKLARLARREFAKATRKYTVTNWSITNII